MSSTIDVLITTKSGESFRLSEYNVKALDFLVSSPPIQSNYGDIEGRDGTIDYGATIGQRYISVPFRVSAFSSVDFPAVRDFLFSLVVRKDAFYVQEFRTVESDDFASYYGGDRRYLVRLQNTFEINQTIATGSGELSFETVESPYAETPWTTLSGLPTDPQRWGFRGLPPVDVETLSYVHTGTSFRIYNAGNVAIHPFDHDLVITIKDVVGSTSSLELENVTSGTLFKVNEAVTSDKTIILNGPSVTSNGLQYLRSTNRQFIELVPGWNDFVVRGATSATVSFDFRFYYR